MSNSRTIPASASQDAGTVTLLSDGQEVSRAYQILAVDVSREMMRIPQATIVLADGDPARETFAISDGPEFVPGKTVEIRAGYRGQEETIFKGIVIAQRIKVRNQGSTLTVECRDKAVAMALRPRSQVFMNQKDSELLADLIRAYGLTSQLDDTAVQHEAMIQYRSTDWDFLLQRSRWNGLLCWVEDGKIRMQKPATDTEPVLTVQYGSSLLDLEAELDARRQWEGAVASAWNPTDQSVLTADAREPALSLNGNLTGSQLAGSIPVPVLALFHSGHVPEDELKAWADAALLYARLSKIQGRVRIQGSAVVKPGTLIQLNGVGARFSGPAFVSGVRHQIANGNWVSNIQVGFPDAWLPGQQPDEVYRLLPAITGLHPGLVTQLEKDPKGEGRIQVRLPLFGDQSEGIWARVATPGAGEERGFFALPEIGDEVLVGFLDNDPRYPVVLGGMHSPTKAAPLTASDNNHEKAYISRSGMKLYFQDEDKVLRLSTPAGNEIELTEKDQAIRWKDQHGNKMVMDASGIQIESSKALTLKAAQGLSAEGLSVTCKGSTSVKMESGGSELSGAAGMTTVKGSLVRIN